MCEFHLGCFNFQNGGFVQIIRTVRIRVMILIIRADVGSIALKIVKVSWLVVTPLSLSYESVLTNKLLMN